MAEFTLCHRQRKKAQLLQHRQGSSKCQKRLWNLHSPWYPLDKSRRAKPDPTLRAACPSAKGKWERQATSPPGAASCPACAVSGLRELSGVCRYLVGTVWVPKASAPKYYKVRAGFFPVYFCVVTREPAWLKTTDTSCKAVSLRSSLKKK